MTTINTIWKAKRFVWSEAMASNNPAVHLIGTIEDAITALQCLDMEDDKNLEFKVGLLNNAIDKQIQRLEDLKHTEA